MAVVVRRGAVVRRADAEGEDLEVVAEEGSEDVAAVVRPEDAEGMHLEAAVALEAVVALEGVEVGDEDLMFTAVIY